jgi:hypothetical protein
VGTLTAAAVIYVVATIAGVVSHNWRALIIATAEIAGVVTVAIGLIATGRSVDELRRDLRDLKRRGGGANPPGPN